MDGLTLREKRQYAGSLGGMQKALNSIADPAAATQQARDEFMREFGTGMHECSLGCKANPFPPELSPAAREKAAQIARRMHFRRLVGRREDLRAARKHNGRPRSLARPTETARTSDARPSRRGSSRG